MIFAHALHARPVYNKMKNRLQRANIPVLVIHGHGHIFTHQIGPRNLFQIQVDRGREAPPLKITIKGTDDESPNITDRIVFADIFVIDRRKEN